MNVLKFGGSSIGNIHGFKNVLNIITQAKHGNPVVVVVSALGGITNMLLELITESEQNSVKTDSILSQIHQKHIQFLDTFVSGTYGNNVKLFIENEINILKRYSKGIALLEECSSKVKDVILSFGEKCSQAILDAALKSGGHETISFKPGSLIQTNSHFGAARVNYNESMKIISRQLGNISHNQIAIVAGFLGSDKDGNITTLGRDGSDYTAGLIAAALKADSVQIWSDVNGVLDADPGIIDQANLIDKIHYLEAAEIAFFGAKVLHPKTIRPLKSSAIPVLMKNTFNPHNPGTLINGESNGEQKTKIVTGIQNLTVIRIISGKARKSAAVFSRLFELLDHTEIPVLMVNQNSADASFSIVIHEKHRSVLQKDIEDTFADEINQTKSLQIEILDNYCIAAVIGYEVSRNSKQVLGFFNALNSQNIEVENISFGVSKHNISALLGNNSFEKAIIALHNELILTPTREDYKMAVNQ